MVKNWFKLSVLLSMMFCVLMPLTTFATQTEVHKKETDVVVEFEKTKESDVVPPKPPVIDPGGDTGPVKILPSTGEIITSIIVMLIGLSVCIFVLGVTVLRQIHQKLSWEY